MAQCTQPFIRYRHVSNDILLYSFKLFFISNLNYNIYYKIINVPIHLYCGLSINKLIQSNIVNHIKGFNEPRYILIQTLNSNQNRSATLTIRTGHNKKLIDNNQHCCNKKQYFLSLSLIMVRKKSFTPLVRANMTNAAISGEPQRRAARNRRGAPPGLNINYP